MWDVNSQSHGEDCTACCKLAANIRLPSLLGWTPSVFKREKQSQNRLKLSIKKHIVSAGRLEPGMETEDSAETPAPHPVQDQE